jgi:DNA-binding response OmpR family regulator
MTDPCPLSASSPPHKGTILIVEDDQVFRHLLAVGLTDAGYDVVSAEPGARAMELLASLRPHVILLDLLMPVMDGLRFLHCMKDASPPPIPTLVLTCLDDQSFAVAALLAGATDILLKPVNLDLLTTKISDLLRDPRP